jgi:protoporphyrin/coproporphyrin ferrochelatase
MKIGVMLVNLGTPDAPTRGAVYRYLKQFLLDRRVIDIPWLFRQLLVRGIIAPFRSGSSSKLYQRLWTDEGSPIKSYGVKLSKGVQELLGPQYKVRLAMRYQSPSIEKAARELLFDEKVDKIIVFPLFPQYASATTGSVHDEVMRLFRKWDVIPDMTFINSYPTLEALTDIFATNASAFDVKSYDHIIFSFHGLPQRQLRKGDITQSHCLKVNKCCEVMTDSNKYCYSAQCHQTSFAIANKLGLARDQYTISFQSRLGVEAWAQPYTNKVIEHLEESGKKRILVFSPAFVADCLETTIEIGYEYKEEFIEAGGEALDLVPSLNDDPRWIKAVADYIKGVA